MKNLENEFISLVNKFWMGFLAWFNKKIKKQIGGYIVVNIIQSESQFSFIIHVFSVFAFLFIVFWEMFNSITVLPSHYNVFVSTN